jgi:hypothetical protein
MSTKRFRDGDLLIAVIGEEVIFDNINLKIILGFSYRIVINWNG